jgi:uncharacterized membrane protein
MVIQDLFVTVTLVTLIHAVTGIRFGKERQRIHWCGIALGVISSVALAFVKNTTNKIVSSRWNHKIYIGIVLITAVYLLLLFIFRDGKGKTEESGGILTSLIGSCLSFIWIFYALPGSIAYPFTFNTMGNGYLSWYFFQRLIGWALAFLILAVYAKLLYECALNMKKKSLPLIVLALTASVNAFYCFCRFFAPWVNRAKWLNWPVQFDKENHGWAYALVRFSSDHAMDFIWITAVAVLILTVYFFFENTRITDPYDNPAQRRKLRAGNRKRRREAFGSLLFLAVCILSMSVVKAYDTREVSLSEPETYTVKDGYILVSMDDVSDGHLHRFEYRTKNDVNVRWIVVKKPGSASFGTGLDACEVCGNAGYYENNGKVICKRCDVVMNINTIGFKGGCNPIPLSYEVRDGNLVFAIEDLEDGEREFK